MTLAAGSRLGPYEIVSPLGAGGMGEVFRARDTRLAREVAIKVLPAAVAADPERLKRFEKEARSASALNHPNIVTIYDIGSTEGVSWIAMEMVDGKTLRELLVSGALPVKRLLQIATSVAEGLAKAHEAGIVHRDLKPENVMVTKDGLVKILDFGLAKLTSTGSGSGEGSHLPTMTGTTPGVVVGTVGYMSPEQASGETLDFRSDQFSFGSVLYEMATGKRAFQKKTAIDTLGAILNSEPEPIAQLNPGIPAPLRWIAERCLAKEPDHRYASTKDLARELATVRDHLSEASLSGTLGAVRAPARRRWLLQSLAGATLVALGLLAGKVLWMNPPMIPRFQRVTFRRGVTWGARFAPDGQTIVYAASWEGNPWELYTTRPGGPESRSLGLPPANILAISSTAEMAVQLIPSDTLARVPLAGGAPREILENVLAADWSPDGQTLAVIRGEGGKSRLEFPPGKLVYEAPRPIERVRISPKGDLLLVAGVGLLDTAGKGVPLPALQHAKDAIWSRDGTEIWFLKEHQEAAGAEIRAVSRSGRERQIAGVPGDFRLHDVSHTGVLLMEHVTGSHEILGGAQGRALDTGLSWLSDGVPAGLSADGKRLLIASSFRNETYLRPTDGSAAIRLGAGRALALSPDGNWALVLQDEASGHLALVPTGAGETKAIELKGIVFRGSRHGGAAFFPDGKRLLLSAEQPGRPSRLYAVSLEGGSAQPVTPEGVSGMPLGLEPVAPDGKTIVAPGPDGLVLYGVDAGGSSPRPIRGLVGGETAIRWSPDGRALFVEEFRDSTTIVSRLDLGTGQKQLWKELRPADPAGVLAAPQVLITPDGKSWVYSYWRDLSDLYVVDGLK